MAKKRSFFERLTGGVRLDEEDERGIEEETSKKRKLSVKSTTGDFDEEEFNEEEEDGQLSVDVYQTPTDIVIQTMVAGVRPEDLSINITRDMVNLKGRREVNRTINDDNYFVKELYWGSFSRSILLPQEIEPEDAEAMEKHGLLIIKLPKIDKNKQTNLKVKSV
ncbi:MAG: Hsp20/alpha crystallin family protein [Candidatus Paceibacterota bacterium]|jgi:HSP20 family protein